MRPMQVPPRARWKTAVVAAPDPAAFAQEFENRMNELVSDGWNIHGMIERGGALIITAIRPDVPQHVLDALSGMSPAIRHGLATLAPKDARMHEEAVYNYQELGESHSIPCTLAEAVSYFEEHAAPWAGSTAGSAPAILPISIVTMQVTAYELADIPELKARVKGV